MSPLCTRTNRVCAFRCHGHFLLCWLYLFASIAYTYDVATTEDDEQEEEYKEVDPLLLSKRIPAFAINA